MTVALQLDDVSVQYGRRGTERVEALRDVTLSVDRGERVAIVGRSGTGKSTLAFLALGLVRPTAGEVTSLGVEISGARRRDLRALRRRMHLVFQDPFASLHPGYSIGDLVAEPLLIAGRSATVRDAAVVDALSEVGLAPPAQFVDRHASSLSGGQRQRVAIARAVVAEPELIIADEPTSMLDASLRATVAELLLATQKKNNAALIFITHDLALARFVSDRTIVLDAGRVVEDRPTDELLTDPQHRETKRLVAAARHDAPNYSATLTGAPGTPSGGSNVT